MLLWTILLVFVIDIQSVNAYSLQSDQAYHTDRKTWKAASEICSKIGLEFDEKVLTNIAVLQEKEFWIGMAIYHIATPWIESMGCYSVPDGQEIKKSPSIVLCQKQCVSYQFFGYSESTENCFCHQIKSSSHNISNCIDNIDSKYSFVYKVYTGHVSDNGDGKCTTLLCSIGGNGLKSANCNDITDTARASRCNDGIIVGWGKPYSTGKQVCLERFQLLLPPDTYCQLNHIFEGIPSWTNVFRAETEAKLTKAEAGTKEPLSCLAGSITGKRVLNVTRRACNDQLQFLCRIDEASAPTSSQIVIATRTMKKDSSGSIDIGPVIGGITGAITLLAVLFVMIYCKIRSCGFFKSANTDKQEVQFSKEFYEHSQNPEVRTIETPISNKSYGLAPINSSNTYAVVNKIKKNGLQTTEDTYTETSYGEYDRLNVLSKNRTDSKTNLYDSHAGIRNESDPTYDSSNHGGRKLQLDNDVYDHTDTLSTDGSDYGYSSTLKSETRNENDVYDKAV
ncbi:uncharacterized protein LOC127699905 [Mytilus californianus]|uniref:uncharacterized protein LOC127699905 n=1 Tax=Mytilus californianus TaxID=6549 RepID=UPI002245CFC6|nr:uncharacterized protein LOC127699905 [Mytilus californianus]